MSFGKWLSVTISLVVLIGLTVYVGTTGAFFVDIEQSTDDSLGFQWGFIILDDGFDGTPWDEDWDENGTTTWIQSSDFSQSGSYSAKSDQTHLGYLISDEIDASESVSISVMFDYYPVGIDTNDVLIQGFNGSTYVTLFDLRNHSNYSSGSWCVFNEVITDSQFFIPGFRLRFASASLTSGEAIYIDDVMVITDSDPPSQPQNLTATAGDREIFLDWDDNSLVTDPDLDGYDVYVSLSSGGPFDTKVNTSLVTTSAYTATNLTNGTTYYYVVKAVDIAGNPSTASSQASATPYDAPPHTPTGLTATPGDTLVELDWDDNTDHDFNGYYIYRRTSSGNYTTPLNGSLLSTSNYTDTGRTNGETYYYVVTAVDDNSNESNQSTEASATPTDLAPEEPTGLAATSGDRQISLDWDDNTDYDFNGYNVYRSLTSGSGYAKVNTSLVATSSYTDTELTGGTTYYYVVTAVDDGTNESGYSNEDSDVPTDLPPSAPAGLDATPGDREAVLSWDANSETDIAGYDVYRSTTNGTGFSKVNTSLVTLTGYTDVMLSGGTTYYYKIKAVDSLSQASAYSNQAYAIPTDYPPSAPTGLSGVAGDRQAVLSWNANLEPDLAGYNLYRSLTSGSGYSKINTSMITMNNYTDTGLTGGVTYYYVLKAVDLGGDLSGYSNQASITADDYAPDAPTGLDITPGDGSATLDWNDNTEDDLDGYNVYRSTTSGSGYAKVNTSLVENSTYLDSGLTGQVTYYYVVTAVDNAANESEDSAENNVTPSDLPPDKPTGLVATPHDASVDLDWNDSADGDLAGYNVYRSITSGSGYSKLNGSLVASSDYTDSTAVNGQKYYYVVTAVDITSSESVPSTSASATPNATPGAPTGLTATGGNKEIDLDWNDHGEGDVKGYNVYRRLSTGGPYTKVNPSLVANTTSNYTNTGLTGGTAYYYVVTAVDTIDNESAYSTEANATPGDYPPSAPTNLSGVAGERQASLNWDDNTEDDLAGYNVYRSETSGSGHVKVNTSLVTASEYVDTGLVGGTTYYYIVKAVDLLSSEGSGSNEASVQPYDYAPSAPTGLIATAGDKQVSLDWNNNTEDDLAGYNVYRSETSGSGYAKVNTSLVGVSEYVDTGLVGGTTYYYVVTAVDLQSHESDDSSEDGAIATDADPSSPTGLTASDGLEEVTLNWNDNTDPDLDGYNVYRSTTSGSGYVKLNTVSLVTSSTYTDTNLTAGETYYYVVTAVDEGENESPYSNEVSGTPVGPTVINDSFDQVPWYDNFDDNGATTWVTDTSVVHTGTYSAKSDKNSPGSLTSDNLFALLTSSISINFWYYPSSIETGDVLIQVYNGSTYNTLIDLTSDSEFTNNTWCEFNYVISDSQYFISNFHIRFVSIASGNDTIYVDDVLIVTDDMPPLVPTGLVATAGEQVNYLDWDDNIELDLDGYNVYRKESVGANYTQLNGSIVASSEYTDTGLSNGTTYYYVVSAVDLGSNESEYSNSDDATPQDFVPAAPTGLSATPGYEQISLEWNENSEIDIDGYNLYRSTTTGTGYSLVNTSGLIGTANYTDTGLTGDVTYYYILKAVDESVQESTASSEVNATAINSPPALPTGLTATPGDRYAFLDWDDNSETDLNGYNVYRSLTSGSGYSKINSGLVGSSNYTDTGLTGDITYYYVVTAVDDASNESANSTEASVTPTDPAPSSPTNLSLIAGDKQVSLDWDDNTEDDLDGYNVYRGLEESCNYTKVNSGVLATSDYIDTGLTGYVNYYYKVTALDLAGHESSYSGSDNATPSDPPPAAPLHLFATTEDLDAEVYLWWTAVNETDVHGYNLYRKTAPENPYSKINGTVILDSNYLDTGLADQTTYYFVVTTVDDGGYESGYSAEQAQVAIDYDPEAPTGLAAVPHDAYVTLDWNDNIETDIAGYWVYRSTSNTTGFSKVNSSNMTTTSDYTDDTVVNDTTYFYYVTAEDLGGNESDPSIHDDARPDQTPAAPQNLAATEGDRLVTLVWDEVSEPDVTGYNVYRSITSGTGYTKINTQLVVSENYTDSELTGGLTYYYVVTAKDAILNESAYSAEDSATPYDSPPLAPTNLAATSGDRQAGLNWDDNTETDLAGYNVYRSVTTNTTFSKINGSLVTSSAYTDTNLTGGETYYYMVTAQDDIGQESIYSNEDNVVPMDAFPAAPTGLVATQGDKQVSLDWNDNAEDDLAGYWVYRSVGDNTSYSKLDTGGMVLVSSYTDTGLTGGVTYYYKVTAEDDIGQESAYSAEDSATAIDAPPTAPTGLVATPHDAEVTLDWNDNTEDDIAGYHVYRSETSGSGYVQLNGSLLTVSSYTDDTATNDVTYYYVVKAVDDGSNLSDYSNEDSATPNATPAAPSNLAASAGNTQVNLDWDDNAELDIAGYNVYRSSSSGGPYTKINISIVENSAYTDINLTNGTTYYYVVTAVDTIANESGYSGEDSATPSGLILMNDGFEGSPWYGNWDNNGPTDWITGSGYNSATSARHQSGDNYLISDDMDASSTVNGINITFWFNVKATNKGPIYVEIYNGSTYTALYDLRNYPGFSKNTWLQFNENVTDSQYFISNFRLRFDGSSLITDAYVDDVYIVTY
jgi:fibronectin type 3 domain-containing protein